VLVAGIHHVSINVSDTDQALHFYCDVLGLEQLPRPDFGFGGAWLDAGHGRQVHLIEGDVPPALGQHVAFQVDDVDRVVEQLRAQGIAIDDAKSVGGTPTRQAFAHDPDGNLVEFTQIAPRVLH
jgi:glyoxylase I family protein